MYIFCKFEWLHIKKMSARPHRLRAAMLREYSDSDACNVDACTGGAQRLYTHINSTSHAEILMRGAAYTCNPDCAFPFYYAVLRFAVGSASRPIICVLLYELLQILEPGSYAYYNIYRQMLRHEGGAIAGPMYVPREFIFFVRYCASRNGAACIGISASAAEARIITASA